MSGKRKAPRHSRIATKGQVWVLNRAGKLKLVEDEEARAHLELRSRRRDSAQHGGREGSCTGGIVRRLAARLSGFAGSRGQKFSNWSA